MKRVATAPKVVMGTIYIGQVKLSYDVSGGAVVTLADGTSLVVQPDYRDVSLFLHAEALGYGRQVGNLVRDRLLIHCLLAEQAGLEPLHLFENGMGGSQLMRYVDMLVCLLNQMPHDHRPTETENAILVMADHMLHGGGLNA